MSNKDEPSERRYYVMRFDAVGFPGFSSTPAGAGVARTVAAGFDIQVDDGAGLILPLHAFEKFTRMPSASHPHQYSVDGPALLDCQRQTQNLLRGGGWVCFLTPIVVDAVKPRNELEPLQADYDVCRRTLDDRNVVARTIIPPATDVAATAAEFKNYIRRFGVAKLAYDLSNCPDAEVLATAGGEAVGLEIGTNVFVLPLHVADSSVPYTLQEAVRLLVPAIESYRERRAKSLPTWLDSVSVPGEADAKSEIETLRTQLISAEARLSEIRSVKLLLVASGERLRKCAMAVFRSLGFEVDPEDIHREDFKLLTASGELLALVEVKGVATGVRRDHINQVDSHRARAGLRDAIPGILLINDSRRVAGWQQRLAAGQVHPDLIQHAVKQNVLVLRTCDLVACLGATGSASLRQSIGDALTAGGGWLRSTEGASSLVHTT